MKKRRGCYLWQVLGGFPDDQAHGPDITEAESRQLFTDCRCVDYENRCVRYKLISPFILYDPRLILLRNVLLQEYNVVRKLKISILPTLYESENYIDHVTTQSARRRRAIIISFRRYDRQEDRSRRGPDDDNRPRGCLHARSSEHVRARVQRDNVLRRTIASGADIDIHDEFRRAGQRETGQHRSYNVTTSETQRGQHRGYRGDRGSGADRADNFTRAAVEARNREERFRRRHEDVPRRAGRFLSDQLHLLHATVLRLHHSLRSFEVLS